MYWRYSNNAGQGYDLRKHRSKAKEIVFSEGENCRIRPGTINTGENAELLAEKLWGVEVPYDCEDCNMKHYLDYLSQGKTKGAKETCPVFKPLTSKTKIDFQKFRMSGQKVEYAWPSQRYTGSLTAIARAPSQRKSPSTGRVPNVTRSNSPRSRGFLSSSGRWIRRSLSNTSGKNKKLSAEEKMHGSHGGGGVGTTNGGTSGGYSYSGQAGRESGAANRHSAAAGRRPYGGMLPDLSSYWGYGANAGAQQWGASTGYGANAGAQQWGASAGYIA
ncbi:uncharacterized protein [Bemisia tabaci]|uniref:uncharacterized protein n=1 Tax=Bemisia tabaci TaxID=7038 RepID=UPI003B28AB86